MRRSSGARAWYRTALGTAGRDHHDLFMRLLRTSGLATPEPAPGFRFGMLGELDIPPGVEVDPLEETLDQAAMHLFHGRYRQARSVLGGTLPRYPFARKLLYTIPPDNGHGTPGESPASVW